MAFSIKKWDTVVLLTFLFTPSSFFCVGLTFLLFSLFTSPSNGGTQSFSLGALGFETCSDQHSMVEVTVGGFWDWVTEKALWLPPSPVSDCLLRGGQLLCCGDLQVLPWRGPCGKELGLPANSHGETTLGVETSDAAAPWGTLSQNHPDLPLLDSWHSDTVWDSFSSLSFLLVSGLIFPPLQQFFPSYPCPYNLGPLVLFSSS